MKFTVIDCSPKFPFRGLFDSAVQRDLSCVVIMSVIINGQKVDKK